MIILNQGPWSLWAANWIPAALYSQHLWLSSRMIWTFGFLWKYRGRWKENTLLTNWIAVSGMLAWGVVYLNNSSSSVAEKLWIWLHKSRKYASKIFVQICDAIYIHSFIPPFIQLMILHQWDPTFNPNWGSENSLDYFKNRHVCIIEHFSSLCLQWV